MASFTERLGLGSGRMLQYRLLVLVLTFFTYASYHMSRKAPSIVKGTLHPHVQSTSISSDWNPATNPGWSPFSDDLNPPLVAQKGYVISGSSVCEMNGHYKCTYVTVDHAYYNLSFCPHFVNTNYKFSLRLIEPNHPTRVQRLCNGNGAEPVPGVNGTGCWVIEAIYNNLTTHEQTSFCSKHNNVRDCVVSVQPSGRLIPAPSDDKIGWVKDNADERQNIQVDPNMSSGKVLLGSCDTVYLIFYAAGLFMLGHVADNVSLRVFLGVGMIGSGVMVAMIGLADVFEEHSLWYFYVCYAIQGLFQATGWPAVVAVMGNWFGKGTRGLVMGVWNAHTSVGNILGSVISGAALGLGMHGNDWPAAFYLSGGLIALMGLIVMIFLPNHPHDVGLPSHEEEEAAREEEQALLNAEEDAPEGIAPYPEIRASDDSMGVPLQKPKGNNFYRALCIPGVVEFSLALFFVKFVAYMFIYWLPYYLGHLKFSSKEAANLSTFFDLGGIIGGIVAGWVSDKIKRRSPVAFAYLVLSIPALYFYRELTADIGDSSIPLNILYMLVCGAFVNGPYALITTAVSADLGSHPSLQGDLSLTATVTGIIDGTGSVGASIQGVLIGMVATGCNGKGASWNAVFYLLMICCSGGALMLSRLVWKDAPEGPVARMVYRAFLLVFMAGAAGVLVYCSILVSDACDVDDDDCTSYVK